MLEVVKALALPTLSKTVDSAVVSITNWSCNSRGDRATTYIDINKAPPRLERSSSSSDETIDADLDEEVTDLDEEVIDSLSVFDETEDPEVEDHCQVIPENMKKTPSISDLLNVESFLKSRSYVMSIAADTVSVATRSAMTLLNRRDEIVQKIMPFTEYAYNKYVRSSSKHSSGQSNDSEKGPSLLSNYASIRVIGKGGFGVVVLCRTVSTDDLVALKQVKKSAGKQKRATQLRNERTVLSKKHPFMVDLKTFFDCGDSSYFVLEYCPGGDLFFHLDQMKRFPEPTAKFYAASLILVLQHLHSNKFIYRDLKPENVVLDSKGFVRLVDFGLCKDLTTSVTGRTSTLCGSNDYLAPEIIRGSGYSYGVDWWAFGCLLYEMLTGYPPFYVPGNDRSSIYEKILRGHRSLYFPDYLSDSARSLITKLLWASPDARIGNRADAATAIRSHSFFRDIDFAALESMKITPPITPELKEDCDTNYFAPEFTSLTVDF